MQAEPDEQVTRPGHFGSRGCGRAPGRRFLSPLASGPGITSRDVPETRLLSRSLRDQGPPRRLLRRSRAPGALRAGSSSPGRPRPFPRRRDLRSRRRGRRALPRARVRGWRVARVEAGTRTSSTRRSSRRPSRDRHGRSGRCRSGDGAERSSRSSLGPAKRPRTIPSAQTARSVAWTHRPKPPGWISCGAPSAPKRRSRFPIRPSPDDARPWHTACDDV
jgi:hypothetical protein